MWGPATDGHVAESGGWTAPDEPPAVRHRQAARSRHLARGLATLPSQAMRGHPEAASVRQRGARASTATGIGVWRRIWPPPPRTVRAGPSGKSARKLRTRTRARGRSGVAASGAGGAAVASPFTLERVTCGAGMGQEQGQEPRANTRDMDTLWWPRRTDRWRRAGRWLPQGSPA